VYARVPRARARVDGVLIRGENAIEQREKRSRERNLLERKRDSSLASIGDRAAWERLFILLRAEDIPMEHRAIFLNLNAGLPRCNLPRFRSEVSIAPQQLSPYYPSRDFFFHPYFSTAPTSAMSRSPYLVSRSRPRYAHGRGSPVVRVTTV